MASKYLYSDLKLVGGLYRLRMREGEHNVWMLAYKAPGSRTWIMSGVWRGLQPAAWIWLCGHAAQADQQGSMGRGR